MGRRRVPIVLQMEAAECGAASLAMVMAYHGRWVPLEQLREDCGVSRDGSKASNVLRAAREHGLVARGFRKEPAALRALALPAIIHWNFNHFVVLEGFDRRGVHLADPALGRRRVSHALFDESFTGVVLTVEPGPAFARTGAAPAALGGLLARAGGLRGEVTLITLVSTLLLAPGLVIPSLTQVFVDDVLLAGRSNWLGPVVAVMVLAAVLQAGLSLLLGRALRRVLVRLTVGHTARFVWHLLRLPTPFFQARYAGDITHRADANGHLAHLIAHELATLLFRVLQVVTFGALLLLAEPKITGLIMALTALQLLCSRVLIGRSQEAHQVQQQEAGTLMGVSMNGLRSIETLKAAGAEADFFVRWAGHYAKEQNAALAVARLEALRQSLTTLFGGLVHASILTLGGREVMQGRMTVGGLAAFETLAVGFIAPLHACIDAWNQITLSVADAARIDDVMAHPAAPEAVPNDIAAPAPRQELQALTGALEVRNLRFGYARHEAPLVDGVSFSLRPGERVALVGGSGSGKSTVLRLIAGLYTPWEGEVLFDGRPRQEIPRAVLVRDVAMVSQAAAQFQGSVRDNLTLWDTTISDQSLVAAAKDAEVHGVIAERPGSYNAATLEGGTNFSGGQRQRLEIARALVSNPALLLLDEATSALDPTVEARIDDHLRKRGCTVLIVAHRLSTIRDCDQILVLEHGRVIEQGTHDELMSAAGAFATLMASE